MKRSIADQLRQIRDMVASTHWIRGSYKKEAGQWHYDEATDKGTLLDKDCYCLAGLINFACDLSPGTLVGTGLTGIPDRGDVVLPEVTFMDPRRKRARRLGELVIAAINDTRTRSVKTIEPWNDAKSRRREDIIAVLDRAIEKAEASS
jgi:hypothetical protein